ncbi:MULTISPECIES: hypothetical protein [unclassified Microcoleus]|uniref:hypothetical protein n=1 Tax=unclassified Microcoleus TaxID=2642155 RepID=UPI002FD7510C
MEFGLGRSAHNRPDFVQLFYALGRLAPYCGTGHKTTFGLGQTRAQWLTEALPEVSIQSVLAARIDELIQKFMATESVQAEVALLRLLKLGGRFWRAENRGNLCLILLLIWQCLMKL